MLLSQFNLPVLQASLSTRAQISATRQTHSSLKRLVALKAQIQKHVRTPNAIGATTGDTKFQTPGSRSGLPLAAHKLPGILDEPDYTVLTQFLGAVVLLMKTQASQHMHSCYNQ